MSRNYRINSELLKEAHERLKPDVTELCLRLGMSRTMYYQIVNGLKGSPYSVGLVCKELGLEPSTVVELALPT